MYDSCIILSLKCRSIIFFIEIRIAVVLYEFSLLVTFSFEHFEVEFVLVFKICFLFKLVDHVFFLVVVSSSLLIVFLFLEETEVLAVLGLGSLSVFSAGNAVLEC